jgi:hypothetical protein
VRSFEHPRDFGQHPKQLANVIVWLKGSLGSYEHTAPDVDGISWP